MRADSRGGLLAGCVGVASRAQSESSCSSFSRRGASSATGSSRCLRSGRRASCRGAHRIERGDHHAWEVRRRRRKQPHFFIFAISPPALVIFASSLDQRLGPAPERVRSMQNRLSLAGRIEKLELTGERDLPKTASAATGIRPANLTSRRNCRPGKPHGRAGRAAGSGDPPGVQPIMPVVQEPLRRIGGTSRKGRRISSPRQPR